MRKIKILFGISLIANVVLLTSLVYFNRNMFLHEEILYVETPHITMTKSQFELLPESKADIVFVGGMVS